MWRRRACRLTGGTARPISATARPRDPTGRRKPATARPTNLEGARRRFDEVARNLTERNPRASVSMGLAALEDGDTLDELTARADGALYAARRDPGEPADLQHDPRRSGRA